MTERELARPGRRSAPGRVSRTAARLQGAFGGALVALASAVGVLIGLGGIVAVTPAGTRSLLAVPSLPHVTFGVAWSGAAVWPAQLQAHALHRITVVLLVLALAAASVATLNAVVLLAEAAASRRREMAVRAALGASSRVLVAHLLRDVRTLLSGGVGLGVVLGLMAGGALRVTWPATLERLTLVSATAQGLVPILGVAALAALSYIVAGVAGTRRASLSAALAAGARTTDEGRAVALRRWLAEFQMAMAGSLLCATLVLALATARNHRSAAPAPPRTGVAAVTAPAHADAATWEGLLTRLAAVPGMKAESLATPGAVVGLGVRDHTVTQCGHCVRGVWVLPVLGATVMHHAVGPGYFAATGRRIEEGREFTAADRVGAPRVAIVNRTFANSNFENGEPLGHKIKIGTGLTAWYTVVGVVADASPEVLGGPQGSGPAVWLSALQQPPVRGDVILRGTPGALRVGAAVLDAAGWSPGPLSSLGDLQERAAAPLRWTGSLSLGLALLALLLAIHGMHVTSRQVTRRRVRELAIRRAVGATDRRVLRYTLAGTLHAALFGAFGAVLGGTLLAGLLRRTSGGVLAPPPSVYLGVAAVLIGSALLASITAAREAIRVQPAEVLD